MRPQFRPINRSDAQEMAFIARADSRIPLDYDETYHWTEASITNRLDYYQTMAEDDFFDVAEFDGKIVAFHLLKVVTHPPDWKVGNIATLWVDPAHRGQGIAAEIKRRGEEWARQKGLKFIQTNVHVKNERMLRLNREQGFEHVYAHLRKIL